MSQGIKPNKPLYVSSIDEEQFSRMQGYIFSPLVYIFLFFAIGIFGLSLMLFIYAVA